MENQNIQWETWGEKSPQENNEQPQVNWGEQPQQEDIPTWGEKSPQENNEQPQVNWGEQPQQEDIPTWGEQENQSTPFLVKDGNLEQVPSEVPNYTLIGNFPRINISSKIYHFNSNLSEALKDLDNSDLKKLDEDGRYDFNPKPGTELGNIIKSLVHIGKSHGSRIGNCYIYKSSPKESILNIFKGKPSNSFIYFLQADYDSASVILDLSSIGGPSTQILNSSPNILTLIPGWLPFRISKNNSTREFIAIVGNYMEVE